MCFDSDVVVIGGGPAGTAASITCAGRGLKTILIEAEEFPRDLPGESLHPGTEVLFEQLGVKEEVLRAGFPRYSGHIVQWNNRPQIQEFGRDIHGRWLGFQAWRATLDAILLAKAREQGVIVLQPCRALAPLVTAGRVTGLNTSSGTVNARFLIDAAGRGHWLQRHLGLILTRFTPPLVAGYGYVQTCEEGIGSLPLMLSERCGWSWAATVKPNTVAWTRLRLNGYTREAPAHVSHFKHVGPVRGADVTWRFVHECAGDGYFLVGDSACIIDPASSHGVLRALMSGMFAGDLIAQVVNGSIEQKGAVQNYLRWMKMWFAQDTEYVRALYSSLEVDFSSWRHVQGW